MSVVTRIESQDGSAISGEMDDVGGLANGAHRAERQQRHRGGIVSDGIVRRSDVDVDDGERSAIRRSDHGVSLADGKHIYYVSLWSTLGPFSQWDRHSRQPRIADSSRS